MFIYQKKCRVFCKKIEDLRETRTKRGDEFCKSLGSEIEPLQFFSKYYAYFAGLFISFLLQHFKYSANKNSTALHIVSCIIHSIHFLQLSPWLLRLQRLTRRRAASVIEEKEKCVKEFLLKSSALGLSNFSFSCWLFALQDWCFRSFCRWGKEEWIEANNWIARSLTYRRGLRNIVFTTLAAEKKVAECWQTMHAANDNYLWLIVKILLNTSTLSVFWKLCWEWMK